MENEQLIVHGVFLSHVMDALKERGIPHTRENILSVASQAQEIASAYAKAFLQDATKEDLLDAIDTFSYLHDGSKKND
jgi:hypothetical protein